MELRDFKSRWSRFASSFGLRLSLLVLIGASTGCLPPKDEPCFKPYEKIIKPVRIDGGHHLYFSVNDFDFLADSKIQVEEIVLEAVVSGHRGNEKDIIFSINGLKVARRDDRDDGDDFNWHHDGDGDRFHAPMHKYYLNGALSILEFMLKLRANKGELKFSTLGDENRNKILSAQLIVRGKQKATCKPPPPPPPPPAIAPKTSINSTNPSTSPTNLTTMSISFSADQSGVVFRCSLDGAPASVCASPINYSGLANGNHEFTVFATNASGLFDEQPPTYHWSVDSVAPSVVITNLNALPSLTSSTSIQLQFVSSKSGTFTCSLDGVAAACSSPVSYAGLSEGPHTIDITVTDGVGNVSQPATFHWVIDTTAPVATIVSVAPARPINNSSTMEFQFQSSESGTLECAIDNSSFAICTSPLTLNGLVEGSHWFEVRAVDLAGNRGPSATYSWLSDFTAPVVSIVNAIPPVGLTAAKNITVEFTVSENGDTTCDLDGAGPVPCTSPYSAAISTEGAHQLVISSVDAAQNTSEPVTLNWSMDFSAPQINFGLFTPSAAAFINSADFSVEVQATESVELSASLNGNSLGTFVSPLVLSGLAEGAYTLSIDGHDLAGNSSNQLVHQFVVDLTPPQITLQSEAPPISNWDHNSLTFSSNESVNFECNIDSAGFAACASPMALSGLADGDHLALVRAIDAAGNISSVSSANWTVDTVPPEVSLSAAQSGSFAFTFNFSANESPVSFACSLDGVAESSCSSPLAVGSMAPGLHTLTVWVTDQAGNRSGGTSTQVTVAPPITTSIVSVIPGSALTNSKSISFSFAASQAGATFLCSLDGAAASACSSPYTFNNLLDGSHSFKVQAVDVYGTADAAGASYSWSIDTVPPVANVSAEQTGSFAFRFSFGSNEMPATFTCSLDGAAPQSCSSPNSVGSLQPGSHTFKVWAKDQAGNLSDPASIQFTVLPPITTSITSVSPAASLTNSKNISFGFAASQAGATFRCSLDGAAAVTCSSPFAYSNLADGAHTFKVQALDQWGTLDATGATYSWTVDSTAPTVVSISTSTTSTTITVTWTTSEKATTALYWGAGFNVNNTVPDDGVYVTSHSVKLSGLSPNTLYTVRAAGKDQAGNLFQGAAVSVRTAR